MSNRKGRLSGIVALPFLLIWLLAYTASANDARQTPKPASLAPRNDNLSVSTIHPEVVRAETFTSTLSPNLSRADKASAPDQHRAKRAVYAETDPTSSQPALYIIELENAPLATYQGGIANLSATSPKATGARKLDLRAAPSVNYRTYLADRQATFQRTAEGTLGHSLAVIYRYNVVLNGLAVKMTPSEAAKLVDLPDVRSIQRAQWRSKTTDTSPAFLGVPGVWDGTNNGGLPGTKGEGIIVGVIDSGIWPEHPSFADDGSYPPPPATWGGECTPPRDNSAPYTCNNKLIGIQYFLDGYATLGYDGLFFSGRDDDGHGTHTASTAAGNEHVPATIYDIPRGFVSGMAPRAYIAMYKGLGPRGGTTADLTAAIDKAVADGVDVINYSVGSNLASDPWRDADAQAYLAALDAGVFVATSAGNAGPGPATIGSPANAPWVTTVGASYFNRLFLSDLTLRASGGMSLTGLVGATTTPGITNLTLVDSAGVPDANGNTAGNCENPFAPATFQPNQVVLCQRRGVIASWVIGNFLSAGGAGAAILVNSENNYDYNSYLHPIPTVVVLRATGQQIKQFIADHPGEQITVSFAQGNPVLAPDPRVPVDTVVGFSSRGPNLNATTHTFISVNKPDVTAPGIHVLAGASPQYVTEVNGETGLYGQQGQLFQVIQGTSMSSPHVAGVAALLKALHPAWTPSQIRSALMSTALNNGQKARTPAGDGPATPFDLGAGRIDMTRAPRAGFVLDETAAAFAAADPQQNGGSLQSAASLNLASLTQADCLQTCTWVRTIKSTQNVAVDWTVSVNAPPTLTLTVEPQTFSLPVSGTQLVTITANVANVGVSKWATGAIIFTPNNTATVEGHFPVAIRSSPGQLPDALTIETRRNAGQHIIPNLQTISTPDLRLTLYAGEPQVVSGHLAQDPTRTNAYDLEAGGVYTALVNVPATAKGLVVQILSSAAPDLDLYVGLDTNGNGQPDADEELCASRTSSWNEFCKFPASGQPLQSDVYWILIQNWRGSGAAQDAFTYATTVIDANPSSSLTASGPPSATAGIPFAVQVNWNIPNFKEGDARYGVLELADGTNNTILGSLSLTLKRLADDVTKVATATVGTLQPGDLITYTLTIRPEISQDAQTLHYTLTDTLPAGVTLVPGSATLPPMVNGNQLRWAINVPAQRRYVMTTSDNNPSCDTGFGGYVDLEQIGISARSEISGNQVNFRFDDIYGGTTPVNFFGIDYPDGLHFTDDGFAFLPADLGVTPGANTDIPNPAPPNNLIAPLWRDLAVVYDAATNRGMTVAGEGERLMALEYDDVEPAPVGSSAERFDFEVIMLRQPDDTPGKPEIVFAYNNITGTVSPATIGLENAAGSAGVKFAYNNAQLHNGLMICFDWAAPLQQITYAVQINADLPLPAQLTNTLEHNVDLPGAQPETITNTLPVPDVILTATLTGTQSISATANITPLINYTLTVSNLSTGIAPSVTVEGQLPPGTTYVSGGALTSDGVIWQLGDLAGKSSKFVTLTVAPQATALNTNTVSAASGQQAEIVGGIEAKPGAWPWQAAIMRSDIADGYNAQFCGGSLITRDWVMTAAHCVFKNGQRVSPAMLDATIGRHLLPSDEGQRIRVSQIVVHPGYLAGKDPDIALLRLAQPAVLTGTAGISGAVGLVNLATPAEPNLVAPDTFAMVTGWGDRTNGFSDYPNALHQVTVPLVSNDTCRAAYVAHGFPPEQITDNLICAGFFEGGKDACYGDSGGPLVVRDGHGGWKQVGIVSAGDECAKPESYALYTRVPAVFDWIKGEGANTYSSGAFTVNDAVGHQASVPAGAVTMVIHKPPIANDGPLKAAQGFHTYLPLVTK